MRSIDVDLDKLAVEVKKRMIDEDSDSWWAEVLYRMPMKEAFRAIINKYDGAPDSGPMPSGLMVTMADWVVTGISPVDFLWILKIYPWICQCAIVLDVNITDKEYEEQVQKTLESVGVSETKLGRVIVLFKTPDAAERAISNYSEGERDIVVDKLRKWIEHGELIKVEFDLDADTATVIKLK